MSIGKALRKALRLLARPVRIDHGRGGIVIHAYRGYGSRKEAFLLGRVFRQPGSAGGSTDDGTLSRDLVDLGRRFVRHGVGGAVLIARISGSEQRVETDRDGYFRAHIRLTEAPQPHQRWHTMELELVEPKHVRAHTEGRVFVPPEEARYVVISDIDDTVMYTGVANKAMMMWRLFVQGARSRVAFPGVAAFYRALHQGISGCELNPMLYVSRGPWSIYEVLEAFFSLHAIPVGPILFLREWGLTLQRPLPRRARDHKIKLVREMLALYSDLPFILIGDSGQHDPELYTQVVRENPGRVLAIYIRNVTRDAERAREIDELAKEVVDQGSSLVLTSDSFTMARHAYEHGLISASGLSAVLEEREREGEAAEEPGEEAHRRPRHASADDVERGELRDAMAEEDGDGSSENVVVEREEEQQAATARRGSQRK